jgi:hypothetical protein
MDDCVPGHICLAFPNIQYLRLTKFPGSFSPELCPPNELDPAEADLEPALSS